MDKKKINNILESMISDVEYMTKLSYLIKRE